MTTIRAARPAELRRLSELEDLAGAMYAEAGLPADLPGLPLDAFELACEEGLLWVVADAHDVAVGFALCWRRPDALHLRELDVHPGHMRRGLGRRLIAHVRAVARAEGRTWVTLTTFAEVPWNAPLYRRYGFTDLTPATLPPWLAQLRLEEAAQGLDRWPRVAMAVPSNDASPQSGLRGPGATGTR